MDSLCGAIGFFLLGVVVWTGLPGVQCPTANFAPTFVYVIFWVGLVPVSVLFGDVFRAFNPWRAVGRAVGWVAQKAARGELPAPLRTRSGSATGPPRPGSSRSRRSSWWLRAASEPETLAIATLVYSALTWVAMALYGVEAWIERGEAFSVYFNLFSRISPFERRDGVLGLRRPLSGLARFQPLPGTVPLLAVMIGSVTFDGSPRPAVDGIATDLADFFKDLGLSPEHALEAGVPARPPGQRALHLRLLPAGHARRGEVGGGFSATGSRTRSCTRSCRSRSPTWRRTT